MIGIVQKKLSPKLLGQDKFVELERHQASLALPKAIVSESFPQEREKQKPLSVVISDGLWDWNLQTNEIYFSPCWKAMLGYQEDEIGDSPIEWLHRVHLEDIEKVRAKLTAHLAGRAPHFENEHRLLHKDGNYRWLRSQGRAVWDADRKPYHMIGFQTDLTQYKQAAEEEKLDAHMRNLAVVQSTSRPSLSSVFGFIKANYREPIGLREVAQAVGYSPAYLTTLVQQETGRTVNQWITEYRMAEARLLLLKTNQLVNYIAPTVGYQGVEHFIRQFRQLHGMTPKAWREKHRS